MEKDDRTDAEEPTPNATTNSDETAQPAKENAKAKNASKESTWQEEMRQQIPRDAVSRKRMQTSCATVAEPTCGERAPDDSPESPAPFTFESVNEILTEHGAVASLEERKQFVKMLTWCIRRRDILSKQWRTITSSHDDIVALIHSPRASGEIDEAIWRCFLAAHFGRPSAHGEQQIQSAAQFLCAFGSDPFWTWERLSQNTDVMREWLIECADDLATLQFGNHRKYESQKPDNIWPVIESFVSLAKETGSPIRLITVDVDTPQDVFDVLYRRLRPLKRFGRTGWFDFLILLLDLGLISAEPRSCYLRGATGPLKGAKKLWGKQTPKELDELAADLSERLEVSPIVMEDALCNWQK